MPFHLPFGPMGNPDITKRHREEDIAARARNKQEHIDAAQAKRERRQARNMRNALFSETGHALDAPMRIAGNDAEPEVLTLLTKAQLHAEQNK